MGLPLPDEVIEELGEHWNQLGLAPALVFRLCERGFLHCEIDFAMQIIVGDDWRQPYVDLIRSGSTTIKGVSIEADYTHLKCPRCATKLYSEDEWKTHMLKEHLIRGGEQEVHGLRGKALSLVVSPEEPGVADTTINLVEMYEKPVSRLLETVNNERLNKSGIVS